MKFIVTGGRGFIGSHFVEAALKEGHKVLDIDKMTYAANKVLPWDDHPNYCLQIADISEIAHLPNCDVIFNFAAESHVDNSIRETSPFVKSNILGVHNLLELIRGKREYNRPLFFHISTDEVYGDKLEGSFIESDKLTPSNPYSSTKAAAEMLILAYNRTYGIKYIISRSANNYGERQFEEKLIPKCISSILEGTKIPIHGDGSYIRDWTYVKDNISALFCILESDKINETYNVSSENYRRNLEVVDEVLAWYGKGRECIEFVPNRWGQDLRYSISNKKLRDLGWQPEKKQGIYKWY
jgi:dTDP-glucose 4,6-dehydratase